MLRALSILLWLAVAWLLWSGHYSREPLIFSFGVASCLLVWWLTGRMRTMAAASATVAPPLALRASLAMLLRLLAYLPWLLVSIARANLEVVRLIVHPAMPIAPRLLQTRASQRTAVGQVIHANSITLSPGTITLDVRDGRLLVHALSAGSALDVERGEIDRRVQRVEGGS